MGDRSSIAIALMTPTMNMIPTTTKTAASSGRHLTDVPVLTSVAILIVWHSMAIPRDDYLFVTICRSIFQCSSVLLGRYLSLIVMIKYIKR